MSRNLAFLGLLAIVSYACFLHAGNLSRAEDPPSLNGGGVSSKLDLQAQLEKGLKARRPVEFQYIAEIVAMVDSGDLPRELVDSSFLWARKKTTRQLQYFQFALQARAKKMGISTPDLDNQLVIQR
jgi:hypothetical protein